MVSLPSRRLAPLTYIGLDDRCGTREYQWAAQGQSLPNSTRTDGTIDLAELRPKGDIRVTVQGAEKELPKLHRSQSSQEKINDGVEASLDKPDSSLHQR